MMKCHYEVLQVERDAADDDIRKSYRKLALKWHPDKNLDNSEEAKSQFQLIQQAYEILSDAQERSWYDRHRDSIIKGGRGSDYQDNCLNVYQYFTTTCFKGYGDDENGFYAVYSEVFNKLSAEDSEFCTNSDSDFEIPVFGNSKSSYEDIVHPFYSYWQSYSTKKSYTWLDRFDIRDAPNRKVLRLLEKENKKIRDKARKERSEEIRALVAFVRKRDKRVQEYTLYLEQKAIENDRKVNELRKKQIMKRKEELSTYVECDWAKFSNLEGELKAIEANLAAEFEDLSDSDDSDSTDKSDFLPHCLACNKVFKTVKAFSNHEKSKKHKEYVELIRTRMMKEAEDCSIDIEEPVEDNSELSVDDEKEERPSVKSIKKSKKRKSKKKTFCEDNSDGDVKSAKNQESLENSEAFLKGEPEEDNHCSWSSEEERSVKTKKKNKNRKLKKIDNIEENNVNDPNVPIALVEDDSSDEKIWAKKKVKNKSEKKKQKSIRVNVTGENNIKYNSPMEKQNLELFQCAVCNVPFISKNELFKHLKSTGHAVAIDSKKLASMAVESTKSKKKK